MDERRVVVMQGIETVMPLEIGFEGGQASVKASDLPTHFSAIGIATSSESIAPPTDTHKYEMATTSVIQRLSSSDTHLIAQSVHSCRVEHIPSIRTTHS